MNSAIAWIAAQLRAWKDVKHAASGIRATRLCVGIVVSAPGRVAAICDTAEEAARVAAGWVQS